MLQILCVCFLTAIVHTTLFDGGDAYRATSFIALSKRPLSGRRSHVSTLTRSATATYVKDTDGLHPGHRNPQVGPTGVYIHIPFCRRRCFYCDFSIKVIGEREKTIQEESQAYTALLLREIAAQRRLEDLREDSEQHNSDGNAVNLLDTIYMGGGTPSLLPVECVGEILNAVRSAFPVTSDCEVTMELDPGTFDKVKLLALRSLGITRVSLGVQSFNQAALSATGRAHTAVDSQRAVKEATEVGLMCIWAYILCSCCFCR